ncbi:MAG TPA: SPW repeat protein [Labilithrix sp.]|jgi:hypothetical protein|nr:SPW repeat protein [Labilithrix sp.]
MRIDWVAAMADIVLGAWLLVSMIFWTGSPEHMANAGAIGVASIGLGAMALRGQTWARWIVAALAVWLFLSPWVLPRGTVMIVINHLIVGTLLFGFSALPTKRSRATGAFAD